jgi:alpha-amylase
MGGDLAGITAKIKEGYFDDLGVTRSGSRRRSSRSTARTDEGTGKSYGFHGYWARDFTAVDANLGTEKDLRELVDAAHAHGIRVLLDVVMNHTGPVTEADRCGRPTGCAPTLCALTRTATTIECTLVKNLPDFRTDSNAKVDAAAGLAAKWKQEGRYEREVEGAGRLLQAHRLPARAALLPDEMACRLGAQVRLRRLPRRHRQAHRARRVERPAQGRQARPTRTGRRRIRPASRLGDQPFFMTAEVYGYGDQGRPRVRPTTAAPRSTSTPTASTA